MIFRRSRPSKHLISPLLTNCTIIQARYKHAKKMPANIAVDDGQKQTSKPHEVRTAADFRQNRLFKLQLSQITQTNPAIRLLRFRILSTCSTLDWDESDQEQDPCLATTGPDVPFHFLPGQWLDVHIPTIRHAGGFTITSTPQDALPQRLTQNQATNAMATDSNAGEEEAQSSSYVELAVQYSPSNPAAAWFWQPSEQILNSHVKVRIGGGFVWPPSSGIPTDQIKKVVFVAGGVGINPLISMISHIYQMRSNLSPSAQIHLLYSTRLPSATEECGTETQANPFDRILFLSRLRTIIRAQKAAGNDGMQPLNVRLYVTNLSSSKRIANYDENLADLSDDMVVYEHRIAAEDLQQVVVGDSKVNGGRNDRDGTVCYVCGPPAMTDEFIEVLQKTVGGEEGGSKRVFYEKWW